MSDLTSKIRSRHTRSNLLGERNRCGWCQEVWPCTAISAATEIDRLTAENVDLRSRSTPADCTCGYGGFHEPRNRNCDAHDPEDDR